MAVGKIGSFDLDKDKWDYYIDRLEQSFIANDVKDEVKVATLITVMGAEAYDLMANLCMPEKPSTKTFKALVAVMKEHLQPRPSLLAERFKFRHRVQGSDESVVEYAAELKKLSKDCKFVGDNLQENLRDQFVCGLARDSIRQRLFAEDDIKFERAFKLAVAMEAAEANAAIVENRGSIRGDISIGSTSTLHQIRNPERERAGGRASHNGQARSAARQSSARDSTTRRGAGPSGTSGASGGGWRTRPSVVGSERAKEPCRSCGGQHAAESCKFRLYVCRVCNKEGHLKRMCPRIKGGTAAVHNIEQKNFESNSSSDSDEVNNYAIHSERLKLVKPYTLDICVNNKYLTMEIDTGSSVSCISLECYRELFSNLAIKASNLSLRYYTGELVKPVGKITPIVTYKDRCKYLDLYIVDCGKTSLLGRQWLGELGIEVPVVYCNNMESEAFNFNVFSSRYRDVFGEGLGRFTGGTVGFRLRPDARPVFLRARPLAYALREPVERALEQLVSDGVLEPVHTSEWATPIVPIMKNDGTIRVCGDFKLTLNKFFEVDRFPLPRVDDLLTKLHGGQKFTKLDLSQAYAQFELDEESKSYAVINTHKGLFKYNRLIYGLASSPGIFQRKLEQLFADMPRVGVFLDDVIITGRDDQEHLATLTEVFKRFQKYGLKVKKSKCAFFADSVTYLGFVISKEGVHTCPDKLAAIEKVSSPRNVTELRSFLGLVMYYAKFIPNISSLLAPLYNLLRKDVKFSWDESCNSSFSRVKDMLMSSEVLAHYSPELPLILTTDASSVGLGAVISHLMSANATGDGTEGVRERPVAYASRSLNKSERGYSQIEKEALSIIFGIKKFHQYLFGRKFILRTDHKPLVTIFGDKAGIPVMAASRMQRWAVLLSGYNYDIEYVRSDKNAADALSRLPTGVEAKEKKEVTYIKFIQNFLPITRKTVKEFTSKDDTLQKVVYYLQVGWPNHDADDRLKAYVSRKTELYLDRGCVVWGYRLVIPKGLQDTVLKELHIGHMGIVKMKSVARSYVWWPGIDADIERACRECASCAAEAAAPPRAEPRPWPYISGAWSRLHLDFLGPLGGRTYLVLVDSSTKWIEAFSMQKTTASAVIKVLEESFARFGLPLEIVSDNGPPFTSREFRDFLVYNDIRATFSAAYHPSSNGAAEGAVKLCKRAIKKALRDGHNVDSALQSYLMTYRNVEHSSTGASPAMLLQHRNLRTRLDLLKGSREVEIRVHEAQQRQVRGAGGAVREFSVGDKVWTRDFREGKKWLSGQVHQRLGSRNYIITREDGQTIKRHVDQMKSRWNSLLELPIPDGGPSEVMPDRNTDVAPTPVPSESEASAGRAPGGSSPLLAGPSVTGPCLRPRPTKPPSRYGFESV